VYIVVLVARNVAVDVLAPSRVRNIKRQRAKKALSAAGNGGERASLTAWRQWRHRNVMGRHDDRRAEAAGASSCASAISESRASLHSSAAVPVCNIRPSWQPLLLLCTSSVSLRTFSMFPR